MGIGVIFLITRCLGLTYSIWLDFYLSICFMVLEMPRMPSRDEDGGAMSVLAGPSCQRPRACRSGEDACRSGEDACRTSRSLGAAEPFTNTSRNKSVPSSRLK